MAQPRRVAIALDIVTPFENHQTIFSGVMRFANEHRGWQCIIDEHPGYRQAQRRHRSEGYDGVIARAGTRMQNRLKRQGIPLVNTHFQQHRPGLAGAYMDTALTGRLAAEHLINRGYSRLAALYYPHEKQGGAVFQSFMDYAEQVAVPCSAHEIISGDTSDTVFWLKLETFMDRWLSGLKPPIALFVDSTIIARMTVEFCKAQGLHVPQDVAVLCFRESKNLLEIPTSISSIDSNYEQIGYEAAAQLERLMQGESVPDEPIMVPPKGIIARTSTDHFAVDDELVAEALRRVSSDLSQTPTVDNLAYALAVSTATLQNRFRSALGRSVGAEVRRLRLSAAKVMLAQQEISIESIAKRVGYGSADVLGHVFRREFGVTPHAFRKSIQNKHR